MKKFILRFVLSLLVLFLIILLFLKIEQKYNFNNIVGVSTWNLVKSWSVVDTWWIAFSWKSNIKTWVNLYSWKQYLTWNLEVIKLIKKLNSSTWKQMLLWWDADSDFDLRLKNNPILKNKKICLFWYDDKKNSSRIEGIPSSINSKSVEKIFRIFVLPKFKNKTFICNKNNWQYLSGLYFWENIDIDSLSWAKPLSKLSNVNKYSVVWEVYWSPKNIYVVAVNYDLWTSDFYRLRSYKSWDKYWKYNIDPKFWNNYNWTNIYFIIAEYNDWIYVKYFSKKSYNIKNAKKNSQKYCMLDVCNNVYANTVVKSGIYYQHYYTSEDHFEVNVLYKTWQFIEEDFNGFGGWVTLVFKIWNYYIKQYSSNWCWWSTTFQEVYDLSWNLLKNVSLKNIISYPDKLVIWNLIFKPFVVFKTSYSFRNKLPQSVDELLISSKDKKFKILDPEFYIKTWWFLIDYKLQNFTWNNTYSNIWGFIEEYLVLKRSLNTWKDAGFTRIMDLNYTKKILNIIESWWVIQIVDKNWYEITPEKLKANWLPIFVSYPIDDKYEVILTTRGHKCNVLVEMCKPAIYVYDKKNRFHKITIDAVKWSKFVHLEPNFNINNWRIYKSKNWKVIVNNQDYDYLYYAIMVPNYVFNTWWWFVNWNNVVNFFHYVFPKIWFDDKEKSDFINYWHNKFKLNYTYFISFKYNNQIAPWVKLKTFDKPNHINRVIMEAIELPSSRFSETNWNINNWYLKKLVRWGEFDVFEWWWVFVDLNWKMFVY